MGSYSAEKELLFSIGQGQPSTHENISFKDDEPDEEPADYYNGRFQQTKLTDEILNKYWITTRENRIFLYDLLKGYYEPIGEAFIKSFTEKALGQHFKRTYAEEVIYQVKARTELNPVEEPPENLINVENGLLDLYTLELKQHSPRFFFTSRLNAKHNPKAKMKKIGEFLIQITGTDKDDLPTLQEFAGYTLLRSYKFHKSLLLIGDGANGKSTFLNLIKNVLGVDNITSISLQDLNNNRFALARLRRKHANIYPDLSSRALKETGIFKMAVGSDLMIDAEVKYVQDGVRFDNFAKFMFSANVIPEVPEDDSDAFFRRWIIINFPNKFEGEKCDYDLLSKLTTPEETSGLLNWMIEGLHRLLEQKRFTKNPSTDEIRTQYKRMSSSLYCFLADETENDPHGWIGKDTLYNRYIMYCTDNSLPTKSKSVVTKTMPVHRPHVREGREQEGGRSMRVWRGIKLKEHRHEEELKPDENTVAPLSSYALTR